MTSEEFIAKLTDLMDTEAKLELSTNLNDVEDWDSLSMVAFFSYCNAQGKKITPEQIKNSRTVADLFKLAGGAA